MKLAINIQKLSFHYEDAYPILKLDSFEVKNQEKIFIYGPSGCGKSTLLGLIAGVFLPQQGTLEVCGLDFCSTWLVLTRYRYKRWLCNQLDCFENGL